MKWVLLNYLLILLFFSNCGSPNVLKYKDQPYYTEQNLILGDTITELLQNVCYNKLAVIDEEHCYELKITFYDPTAARQKGILDLSSDTSIVSVEYGIFSIWNWDNEHNEVDGKLEILHWDAEKVVLKENLKVTDHRRQEVKRYKGMQIFLWSDDC